MPIVSTAVPSRYLREPTRLCHLIAERAEFFCSDDAAAKEHAKQLTDRRDIELWRLDQQIARFDAKQQ